MGVGDLVDVRRVPDLGLLKHFGDVVQDSLVRVIARGLPGQTVG